MGTEKNKQIEEILGSLDGVKRASPPDFYYTRLKARMEKELMPVAAKRKALYPVYVLAALVLLIAVNAALIFTNGNSSGDTAMGSDTESIQSIAAEYSINDISSIYDLNEDR